MDSFELTLLGLKTLVIYLGFVQAVPVMVWGERRIAALIQDRPGPNRVGPLGLFQPIADFTKFFFKEDPIPFHVNKLLFALAPFLCLIPASLAIAAIPFGDYFTLFGHRIDLQIANLDIGILYVLGIGSLGIYGILFGGWASNNKFSLLGAMRAASQMISYELPLALAATAAVVFYGTFNLREIVILQDGVLFGILPNWGIWTQPLGFGIFCISAFAETNRLPFDLPETEAELVAGYHTEYGSMKLATFFLAEYINMTVASAMMVILFFGGWHLPWITDAQLLGIVGSQNALAAIQVLTFIGKILVFIVFFMWVRWTLPRFKYDQLMGLAWRTLVPLGLVNIMLTAIGLYLWSLIG